MNTKHIEQTHLEELTSELFNIAYTDRAGDLVTSSLSKPYAEASGIEEVKGDFTSYITELPATLKVFVRRLFSAPAKVFGGKSMSQMFGGVKEAYDWLKERVKGGNGIPKKELPAVEDAAHLAENLRVLDSRKVELEGENPNVDGTSFARLAYSSSKSNIKELIDTTSEGEWILNTSIVLPNVEKIDLNCTSTSNANIDSLSNLKECRMPNLNKIYGERYKCNFLSSCPALTEIHMPNLTSISGAWQVLFSSSSSLKALNLPNLITAIGDNISFLSGKNESLEEIYLPKITKLESIYVNSDSKCSFEECPELKKFVIGRWLQLKYRFGANNAGHSEIPGTKGIFKFSPKLIHLEITGSERSMYLNYWNPTMALRTDTTAEDYEDLREDTAFANNLEQFLYNFKTYIADRIDDRTSTTALKIVVSSAIYSAISEETTYGILDTIAAKNWTVESA